MAGGWGPDLSLALQQPIREAIRLREQERCELPSVQYKKKPAPIPRDKKDAGGKGQEDDGAACGPQNRRPIPAYSDSTTLLGAKEVSHDSSDLSVYRYVYIL